MQEVGVQRNCFWCIYKISTIAKLLNVLLAVQWIHSMGKFWRSNTLMENKRKRQLQLSADRRQNQSDCHLSMPLLQRDVRCTFFGHKSQNNSKLSRYLAKSNITCYQSLHAGNSDIQQKETSLGHCWISLTFNQHRSKNNIATKAIICLHTYIYAT